MADQKNEGPGGGPPQLSMEQGGQYQPGQVQVTMAMAGQGQLPTLAPAPLQGQIPGQQQQPPQMHGAGSPMQGPGQPQQQMMMQQTVNQMGQPQFQIIQPSFSQAPGQYASGFPQLAHYNSQGQLVLQPATQFLQPGQPGQQGQMILASQLPQQKAGQQHMIASGPGQQGKPMPGQPQQQPQYLISSTGQLQIPPGQQQMQPPMNLMLPGGMQVAMPGQPGQVMKTADGKPVAGGQPGMPGQPQPQLIAMPGGGMAYMQAGPQQFLTQNGQIIFRAPGTQEQQLMFSPSGTPPSGPAPGPPNGHQGPPPGHQGPVPPGQQAVSMPGPQGPPQRPGMPQAPPGKTAISRSIAPLLNTNSQSQPRMGYNGNMPNQPSPNPKSKQKMSPRGGMNGMGPGRPPGPKPNQPMKGPVMQRMSGPGPAGSPGPQGQMNPGSPRPMMQTSMAPSMPMVSMAPQMMAMPGPPTLTPMMFPTQPTPVPVTSVTGPPPIASMSMSLPPMTLAQLPTQPLDQTSLPPTSAPMPLGMTLHAAPDVGPPTLTMEAPMPNLGPPNLANLTKATPPAPEPPAPTPVAKAVQAVKPQVLTHVIDGHIIKESSQPFPVSPTKKRSALGKPMSRAINDIQKMLDKDIEDSSLSAPKQKEDLPAPVTNAPVKRGPGRPPGSNNKNTESKNSKNSTSLPGEPPEKKLKNGQVEAVAPLTSALTKQQPAPPAPPSAPLVPKVNIARWSVTEVCDFIKKLPGCSDYVEDFMVQEIDGQALMLLQADHLMSAMSIKLGPALKICEQVNQLKNDFAKNCRQEQQARHSEAAEGRDRAPVSDQTKPSPVRRVVFRLGQQVLGKASFLSDTEEEEHGEKLVMDFSDEEAEDGGD